MVRKQHSKLYLFIILNFMNDTEHIFNMLCTFKNNFINLTSQEVIFFS